MGAMQKLAPLMAAQYSQAAVVQVEQAGVTRAEMRAMIRSGALTIPCRGVVRLAGSVACAEQELLAVCLAHGPEAVVCGETACWLWDMPGRHSSGSPIHLLCRGQGRVRLSDVRSHRSRLLVPADVTTRRGVPGISYARAIVDNSGRADLSNRQLGFMIDHGIRSKHLSVGDLHHTAARLATPTHGRSSRRMRLLLADRPLGFDPGASQPEIWIARIIEAAGFGKPVMGAKIRLKGVTWEIDVALVRLKVGWEYQSVRFHGGRASRRVSVMPRSELLWKGKGGSSTRSLAKTVKRRSSNVPSTWSPEP